MAADARPHAPAPELPGAAGRERDLTSAEWRGVQHLLRADRWQPFATAGLLFTLAGGAWWLGFGPGDDAAVLRGSGWALAGLGAAFLAMAMYRSPERPGGKPRRVGSLEGLVRVTGKPARVTVGGVPVVVPQTWAGRLPLGAHVRLEVTPPLGSGGYVDRNRPRLVVSAYDRRLWVANADPAAPSRAPAAPSPAPGARALDRAFAGAPPPRALTEAEHRAVAHHLYREPGPGVMAVVMLCAALMCAWFTVDVLRRGSPGVGVVLAAAAAALAYIAWLLGAPTLRPHPLGRADGYRRAQRLRGRLAFVGLPPRPTIGGVPVVALPITHLADGALVEAEVTPALEDDPRPDRPRIVVAGPRALVRPDSDNDGLALSV